MHRLRAIWGRMRASFWFVPALIVAASLLAAVGLVAFGSGVSLELAEWSPRLFGASADGSREMLAAIGTSMVTVAGVVFSITIVTLSLTSTQYSPRVLRNFMRDRPTQVVLGVFVGIFVYCLVVLRTVRGGEGEGEFVPSLAVLGGLVYALVGVGVLIFFIHHVAQSIQAPSIMSRIAADTSAAIDHLFPQDLGESPEPVEVDHHLPTQWVVVNATRSGYLSTVGSDALMDYARESGRVLRLCARTGQFVARGSALFAVSGHAALDDEQVRRLRKCLTLEDTRTVDQDASFGLGQLVDVAVRALSPGMNDIATACMSVDQLGALSARLAARRIPSPLRFEQGRLRVIAPAPRFEEMLFEAFEPVIRNSRGDRVVLERVLAALQCVRDATSDPRRREALRPLVQEIRMELGNVQPRPRSMPLRERLGTFERSLHGGPAGP